MNIVKIMEYTADYSKNIGNGITYTGNRTVITYQLYSTTPTHANGTVKLSGVVNAKIQARKYPNKIVQVASSMRIEGDGIEILNLLNNERGAIFLNFSCCNTVYHTKGKKKLYNQIEYNFEEKTDLCIGYASDIAEMPYDYSISFNISGYIGSASITFYT